MSLAPTNIISIVGTSAVMNKSMADLDLLEAGFLQPVFG
jgi:hypothetical protein